MKITTFGNSWYADFIHQSGINASEHPMAFSILAGACIIAESIDSLANKIEEFDGKTIHLKPDDDDGFKVVFDKD